MYSEKACLECGGITRKEDVCSRCRQKKQHATRENFVTRRETNALVEVEQSMTLEQAEFLYNDSLERIKIDSEDAIAWHDKRRARARIDREEINEGTLT